MSKKSGKRFDNYIKLFGRENDDRVTLLLGELEDNANKLKTANNRTNYIMNDIKLDMTSSVFHNKNFDKPDPNVPDTQVHSEWTEFLGQLSIRLGGKAIVEPSELELVKRLSNSTSGSLDEFVLMVLSNIAKFSDNDNILSYEKNYMKLREMMEELNKKISKFNMDILAYNFLNRGSRDNRERRELLLENNIELMKQNILSLTRINIDPEVDVLVKIFKLAMETYNNAQEKILNTKTKLTIRPNINLRENLQRVISSLEEINRLIYVKYSSMNDFKSKLSDIKVLKFIIPYNILIKK